MNQVQHLFLHFEKNWQLNHFTADNGMWTGFNRSLCMALLYAKTSKFLQSAKINVVLLFGFPVQQSYIHNRFECVILNEREQILD